LSRWDQIHLRHEQIKHKYDITPSDWHDWKQTKDQYNGGGAFTCMGCGKKINVSPFIAFLVATGKGSLTCKGDKHSLKAP
jgi:hypothetical protein